MCDGLSLDSCVRRGELLSLRDIEHLHKKPKSDKETRLATAMVRNLGLWLLPSPGQLRLAVGEGNNLPIMSHVVCFRRGRQTEENL